MGFFGGLRVRILGLPLGAKPMHIAFWNLVIEKVHKWLASWKKIFFSKGGRSAHPIDLEQNPDLFHVSLELKSCLEIS